MKIKKFNENTVNNVIHDSYYEFYTKGPNDSEKRITINREFYTYDNYSLDSMIDTYIKVQGDKRDITIKKVIIENVDLANNPTYIMKKDAKKYNL